MGPWPAVSLGTGSICHMNVDSCQPGRLSWRQDSQSGEQGVNGNSIQWKQEGMDQYKVRQMMWFSDSAW